MVDRGNSTGTSSGMLAGAMRKIMRAYGMDLGVFLREAGIPETGLDDWDFRFSESLRLRVWREMAERSKDPCLGLHLAEHAAVGVFDALDYVVAFSATLDEALQQLSRFHRVLSDSWAFERSVQRDLVCLRRIERTTPQEAEFFFGLIAVRGPQLTGTDVAPHEVRFIDPAPADCRHHEALFRCPVHFGRPAAEMIFRTKDLALPIKTANPGAQGALVRLMDRLLRDLPKDQSYVERTRAHVAKTLREGPPSLQATARALKASPRTVQRRLREHGTSHGDVVDSVRHEMAMRLVEQRHLSIMEIAFLLGFNDVSGFTRSYKRWTGVTPSRRRAPKGREGARV